MMKIIRSIAAGLAAILAAMLGLMIVGYGFIQTRTGQDWLAAQIMAQANGPDLEIKLEGLSGHIPWRIELAQLEVADGQGVWLQVADAKLDWQPLALLSGEVVINQISARAIAVDRVPQPEAAAEKETSGFAIPRIIIHDAQLPQIALGAGVVTEKELQIAARLVSNGDRLSATLNAQGDAATQLTVAASVAAPFALEATLQEEAGGLIGNLMGLDPHQLSARLEAHGTRAAYNGTLRIEHEKTLFNGRIDRKDDTLNMDATGTVPGAFMRQTTLPHSEWSAMSRLSYAQGWWEIAQGQLALGDTQLALTGRFHPQDIKMESLAAKLTIPELARYSDFAGLPLQGPLMLNAALDGEWSKAAYALRLVSEQLQVGKQRIEALDMRVEGTTSLTDWQKAGWSASDALFKGSAEWMGRPMTLNAIANLSEDEEITLNPFELTLQEGKITGDIDYSRDGEQLEGNLAMRAVDLGALSGNALQALADFNMKFSGNLQELALEGDAALTGLQGLPAPIDQWAGKSATLKLKADYSPSSFALNTLTLKSGTLSFDAEGTVPLGGEMPSSKIAFSMTRQHYPALTGSMKAASTNSMVSLDEIALNMGAMRLEGELNVHKKSALLEGALTLAAPTIQPLGHWLGMPQSSGSLHADLALEAAGKAQNMQVTAKASDLAIPEQALTLHALALTLQAGDVKAMKDVRGELALKQLQRGATRIDQMNVTADSPTAENTAIRASLAGAHGKQAILLDSAATIQSRDASRIITIAEFKGAYGAMDLLLNKPAQITIAPQGFTLSPLEATLAGGGLTAQGSMSPTHVQLNAAWQDVAIETLLAQTYPTGTADVMLVLTGNPQRPAVALNGAIHLDAANEQNQATDIALNMDWQNDRQDLINAALTITSGEPIGEGRLTIPASLSLAPFALSLADNAPLNGAVKASLSSERLNNWMAPYGHRFGGTMAADVAIAGVLSQPDLQGNVKWDKGSYHQIIYGICLENVNLNAAFNGNAISLNRLDATGHQGRGSVKGSGQLNLAEERLQSRIELDKAAIFCDGLADGKINGYAEVNGALADLLAKGELALGPMEIHIPTGSGDTIPSVETIRREEYLARQQTQEGESESKVVTLAIDVTIPERLTVRGRGLEAFFEGGMAIGGTLAKPNIGGELTTNKGRFDLLGSDLEIQSGQIRFIGGSPAQPYINMTAASDSDGVEIQLNLAGRISNPAISLSSDPSLPKDEILARLLFGRPLEKITPFQAIQLAQAAATLAGKSSGPSLLGMAREMLGVDTFSINQDDEGGTSAEAGKYISDRVFVGVEQGSTPESRKIKTEIEITPDIKAESSTDAQGRPGAALEWRYDY